LILEDLTTATEISEETRKMIQRELQHSFRPEFLNRIDETVLFKSLTRDEIFEIIDLSLQEIEHRLKDHQITIELSKEAKELILERAYTPMYGARPIKRFIQKELETKLGRHLLTGDVGPRHHVTVTVENGELKIVSKYMNEEPALG